MFTITESNRAQLEQFHFIRSALLTYKMLIHNGECLQQREQILQKKITNTAKKKYNVFLFMHILLIVSQKRAAMFCCTVSRN